MNQGTNRLIEILKQDAVKVALCHDYRYLNEKTILITGATGLIGINILSSLIEISKEVKGLKVISVIHSNPSDFFISLTKRSGFSFYAGDLSNEEFLKTLPNADIIIHAAGFGQPNKFTSNPIVSLKINTFSTFKLFEKLNVNGRFLFISSSDIYNGLESETYSELQIGNTNTNHPRACYIEGKRTGETICYLYRLQNIKTYSIRLSLTYGPGTRKGDQRVLPALIEKGLKGSIDLLDAGNATRTFCYISDAIEMIWYVLLNGEQNLYNIGGVTKTKIKTLAKIIGEILNVPVNIPDKNQSIEGAPKDVALDMTRLFTEYPKKHFIDLNEGLQNTIEWQRNFN
jgi:UDP-glucuronate decarboxylase